MSKLMSLTTTFDKFGKDNPPNKIIEQIVQAGFELGWDATAKILRLTQGNHIVTNESFAALNLTCKQHKIDGKIKDSKEIYLYVIPFG